MPISAIYYDYATQSIDMTELVFSSRTSSYSGHFNKVDFQTLTGLTTIFKQTAASNRSYDPASKIWTFNHNVWPTILTILSNSPSIYRVKQITSTVDLLDWIKNGDELDIPASKFAEPMSVEDFFHRQAPPIGSVPQANTARLLQLLALPAPPSDFKVLKSAYRAAAMRLHPDRHPNANDMRDLNVEYSAYCVSKGWS